MVGDQGSDLKRETERSWSNLPQDILSLVESRLFAGDRCVFNAVCKSWLFAPSITRPLPPSIDCAHHQSPCLMFSESDNNLTKFFHPVYNGFYSIEIPEISDAAVRFSKYGWLLMSCHDLSLFFFNPISKVRIQLPDIPLELRFGTMCFTSPPTSSECIVVGIDSGSDTCIGVLRRGENIWLINDYERPNNCMLSDCSPILHKDEYYSLSVSGVLGIYNPNDQTWRTIGQPFASPSWVSVCQTYLAEFDENLVAVFVFSFNDKRSVRTCKFDTSRMVWQRLRSLGDKMLYVSRSSSFTEPAPVNGMGNKVYFPKLFRNSGVFYSVSTKKYRSFNGDSLSGMANQLELKDLPMSTWIKPTFETALCTKQSITW